MKIVIVGGTGTLGTCLVEKLHVEHEITVLSRDELKQQEMRRRFPTVRFVLGDIRDKESLKYAFLGADTVFHVAALKHVDVLEANPTEAIKTNVLGTINVAEVAMAQGVKHVVFSSTDKAVLAINTYGMTKALSERYLLSLNGRQEQTRFAVYRWGNVLGSRGSVIHTFAECLKGDGHIRITDPRMTRFWIHIEDAVDFMIRSYQDAALDQPMVPKMKAASVLEIAQTMAKLLGRKDMKMSFVGMRPGEKIHETLLSSHDACVRSDTAAKFTESELSDMLERVMP
jgi:UDP-N-acetylglucosamine 4,6-dehydratase